MCLSPANPTFWIFYSEADVERYIEGDTQVGCVDALGFWSKGWGPTGWVHGWVEEKCFFPASYRFMPRALGCFLEGRNPNKFPWHVWALVENESEMNIWSKSYNRCAENLRYTRYSEASTIGCLNNSFEISGKVGAENHMSEREGSQHHTFLITLVYFKDLLQLKNTSHQKESRKCPKVSNHKPSSTIKGENQSTIINHSALVTPMPLGKDSPASRVTRQAILSDLRRSTHPRFRLLNEALGQLLEDYSLVGVAQCAFGFMFFWGVIFGGIEGDVWL